MKLKDGFNLDTNKMKKTLIIFLTSLFLSSYCYSSDITKYEIGPFSIGQSLFDFVNEDQIQFIKDDEQYPNDKFIRYDISEILKVDGFDFVEVMTKKNDSRYIIENISAGIHYDKLKECLKIRKMMEEEIESIFDANEKQDAEFPSKQDKTGKSIIYAVQYYTKPYPSNEGITVGCYQMTEEINIQRSLRISVDSEEFSYFLINEAYKK